MVPTLLTSLRKKPFIFLWLFSSSIYTEGTFLNAESLTLLFLHRNIVSCYNDIQVG